MWDKVRDMKNYKETDQYGEYDVIEQDNGIKVRLLIKPSQKWKDEHPIDPVKPQPRDAIKELDELKTKLKEKGIVI